MAFFVRLFLYSFKLSLNPCCQLLNRTIKRKIEQNKLPNIWEIINQMQLGKLLKCGQPASYAILTLVWWKSAKVRPAFIGTT